MNLLFPVASCGCILYLTLGLRSSIFHVSSVSLDFHDSFHFTIYSCSLLQVLLQCTLAYCLSACSCFEVPSLAGNF